MKLATADRPIERIGASQESGFSVKANSKAFKILSSNLYRDKILAIVRELSCNAYDAHVAVGRPREPFHVHLPNALEPYFSVRDHGPGLSEEDVRTVYTTYFESTKGDSNDFVGTLGLGSKSPFSYVDSYTVISRHQGMQRTYAMFINEHDCPVASLMGVPVPTTEPDGLEVSIPVDKTADFREFCARAEQVYEIFSPKPIVSGNPSYKSVTREVLLEGDGYKVYKSRVRYNPRAVMGNVAYPLVAASIPRSYSDANTQELVKAILDVDMDIVFPMGSLEFTAGREELSYDQKTTIPSIQARLDKVATDLVSVVSKKFESCATEFEARCLYRDMTSDQIGVLCRQGSLAKWNGKFLRDTNMSVSVADTTFTASRLSRTYNNKVRSTPVVLYDKAFQISASSHLRLFYNDLGSGAVRRAQAAFRDAQYALDAYIIATVDDAELTVLKERFGALGIPLTMISTLPKVPPAARQPLKLRQITPYGFINGVSAGGGIKDVAADMGDGGVYMLMSRMTPISLKDGESLNEMLRLAIQAKVISDTDEVFLVPLGLKKKFIADDNWVEWFDLVRPRVEALVNTPANIEMLQVAQSVAELANVVTHASMKFPRLLPLAKHLPDAHPLSVFLTRQDAITKASNKVISDLAKAFSVVAPAPDPEFNLTLQWKKLTERYPMLELVFRKVSYYEMNDLTRTLADYVKQTDFALAHKKAVNSTTV